MGILTLCEHYFSSTPRIFEAGSWEKEERGENRGGKDTLEDEMGGGRLVEAVEVKDELEREELSAIAKYQSNTINSDGRSPDQPSYKNKYHFSAAYNSSNDYGRSMKNGGKYFLPMPRSPASNDSAQDKSDGFMGGEAVNVRTDNVDHSPIVEYPNTNYKKSVAISPQKSSPGISYNSNSKYPKLEFILACINLPVFDTDNIAASSLKNGVEESKRNNKSKHVICCWESDATSKEWRYCFSFPTTL